MNESQAILLGLFAAAAAAAIFFYRQVASKQAALSEAQQQRETAKGEVERVRSDNKSKRQELEKVREQLKTTKAKLEKARADREPKTPKRRRGPEPKLAEPELDLEPEASAAQVVRVTDRELEAEHRKALQAVEERLRAAETEVERYRAEEARRAEETRRAAEALAAEEASTEAESAGDDAAPEVTPEARAEAMGRELEAVKKAASGARRDHKKELKKLELRLEAAHRRAANDHAAYQVIKGHLELAEDRLATLRRKYEGAKAPAEAAAGAPALPWPLPFLPRRFPVRGALGATSAGAFAPSYL
ncbi:MAG: hypothetical protein AAFZ18_27960, partial [Myxococcota bacterium]